MEIWSRLAGEGTLMPLIRIRDEIQWEANEFKILSYQKVLYKEKVNVIDDSTLYQKPIASVEELVDMIVAELEK